MSRSCWIPILYKGLYPLVLRLYTHKMESEVISLDPVVIPVKRMTTFEPPLQEEAELPVSEKKDEEPGIFRHRVGGTDYAFQLGKQVYYGIHHDPPMPKEVLSADGENFFVPEITWRYVSEGRNPFVHPDSKYKNAPELEDLFIVFQKNHILYHDVSKPRSLEERGKLLLQLQAETLKVLRDLAVRDYKAWEAYKAKADKEDAEEYVGGNGGLFSNDDEEW